MLIAGIILGLVAAGWHLFSGYQVGVLALWLASLIITGAHFFSHRAPPAPPHRFQKADLYTVFVLLALFTPLYLVALHTVPF